MTGRLEGKVALITGAGIVALDIDPKALWQTEAAVAAAVEAGWERFRRLDVLYNNAGVPAHEALAGVICGAWRSPLRTIHAWIACS